MTRAGVIILVSLGLLIASAAAVAWLKGTLGLVGKTFSEITRRSVEPWTWVAFFEPALTVPLVFVTSAVGLAHPDSRWARWFYGERRIARGRELFE